VRCGALLLYLLLYPSDRANLVKRHRHATFGPACAKDPRRHCTYAVPFPCLDFKLRFPNRDWDEEAAEEAENGTNDLVWILLWSAKMLAI